MYSPCVKIDSLVRKFLYMFNLLSLNILNIIDVHSILWDNKTFSEYKYVKKIKAVNTFMFVVHSKNNS